MLEYLLWVVTFLGLYMTIFWIHVLYFGKEEEIKFIKPKTTTILVPAYNEEKNIKKALKSLINLDYPKEKLKIIVINDGSTDKTKDIVNKFILEHKDSGIKLLNLEKNSGCKAVALNEGLKYVTTELMGCLDSDSLVEKDSLKYVVNRFQEKEIAAIISITKVINPNNTIEKLQRLDYIISAFSRKMLSRIETLHVTPGVLSIYRTRIIKNLGGFDKDNITEDLEIAMRIKYNHHNIAMEPKSITYTKVPSTFKGLWDQRVRWYRGFIFNNLKYRKMLFNKDYGFMGTFQFPLNLITLISIFTMFFIILYKLLSGIYELIFKVVLVKFGIWNVIKPISMKSILLSFNIELIFPIIFAFLLLLFIYKKAHETTREKWKYPFEAILYFTAYPLLRSIQWITAMFYELGGTKRKW